MEDPSFGSQENSKNVIRLRIFFFNVHNVWSFVFFISENLSKFNFSKTRLRESKYTMRKIFKSFFFYIWMLTSLKILRTFGSIPS